MADLDELSLFRSAKFTKESPYGELRYLKRGEQPPNMGPMHLADWFAQEADGAVIGRLRLDGVGDALRPIIVIDNEGSLHVTGFSLVDHFGSYTLAASQDELGALLAFCGKHGLPAPRTSAQIAAAAKRLKLTADKLEKGKVPTVSEAALRELRTSAPALKPAAKPAAVAAGKRSSPQAEYLGWAIGPDGSPWVVVPPKEETKTCKSILHRWTGKGFVQAGELRGWIASIRGFRGQLAYDVNGAIGLHDGTKETARLPYEGSCTTLLASSQHLVIYNSWDRRVSKLEGTKFVRVGGEVDADAHAVLLDDHRLLLLKEKKANVLDLNTGKTTKWPKPTVDASTVSAVPGGQLVVMGYESVVTVAPDKGTWGAVKKLKSSIRAVAALEDGDVIGFSNVPLAFPPTTEVFRISPRKLAVSKLGVLHAGRTAPQAFQVGNELVVFGGTSGPGGKPVAPERFDLKTGTGRPL